MNFDFSKIDLKKIDKKVWACIGAGAVALVLVIVLIIVAVSGNSSDGRDSQDGSQKPGSQQTGNQKPGKEDSESESVGSELTGTEDVETESTEGTEVEGTETEGTENDGSGDSQSQGTNNGGSQGTNSSGTESSEPEEGSKELPIGLYPNEDWTMPVTAIEAGKSLYFDAYRVGGMTATIEDADAYVIYNGTRYEAQNGKVVFAVEDLLADRPILLEIGNNGNAKKSFTIKWAAKKGTYENPDGISSLNGTQNSMHIEEDNEQGYFYLYTAEKSGTIKLRVVSASNNAKVYIKAFDKNNSVVQDLGNSEDDKGGYIELKVNAGDVIEISLYARPNDDWEYPASDIVWTGEYK